MADRCLHGCDVLLLSIPIPVLGGSGCREGLGRAQGRTAPQGTVRSRPEGGLGMEKE